ncbi:hypothetical protein HN51_027720, partial [Arachis hypogaea]
MCYRSRKNLSSVKHGCPLHGYVLKFGFSSHISVGNALNQMHSISWSTLISAYGLHGCGDQAWQLFHEMQERGVKSDAITLLAVLSACNHADLRSHPRCSPLAAMPLLLPSKECSSLIRFSGFDLRVRCAAAHLLVTTSNAIIAVLSRAPAIWYNLISHIGGRGKGER